MSNKLFGIDLSKSAESQVEKQPDFDLQNNISGTSIVPKNISNKSPMFSGNSLHFGDKVVLSTGYVVEMIENADLSNRVFSGADINDGEEIHFKRSSIESIIRDDVTYQVNFEDESTKSPSALKHRDGKVTRDDLDVSIDTSKSASSGYNF